VNRKSGVRNRSIFAARQGSIQRRVPKGTQGGADAALWQKDKVYTQLLRFSDYNKECEA